MVVLAGARTPEELETLLEDAFVLRDHEALAQLFEAGAVLDPGDARHQARGREEIVRLASAMWNHECTYLADPRRVLQAQDTALIVGGPAINVMRRGADGAWRYAILVLAPDSATARLP